MIASKALRFLVDMTGLGVLAAGVSIFGLAVAYTIWAFLNPETLYGIHVPIIGVGALLIGGGLGGARLNAIINRYSGRSKSTVPLGNVKA